MRKPTITKILKNCFSLALCKAVTFLSLRMTLNKTQQNGMQSKQKQILLIVILPSKITEIVCIKILLDNNNTINSRSHILCDFISNRCFRHLVQGSTVSYYTICCDNTQDIHKERPHFHRKDISLGIWPKLFNL